MSTTMADVIIAGEHLQLCADRALYWPRRRLLALADLHLGKGDTFRRHGIALPRGGTALDLQRIDQLIAACAPSTLLVLGDLLHGAVHESAHWHGEWLDWRRSHPALDVRVLRGNHDRALQPAQLEIDDAGSECALAPFVFTHDAQATRTDDAYRIGGHLHPIVKLRERGFATRLPVFWLGRTALVLPAFTAFSGGEDVRTQDGDRLFACAGDRIVELPAKAWR